MAENNKKTWVTILIASLVIACVLGIALAGGVAYFVMSHTQSTPIAREEGQARIAAARARFAGQTAMIVADLDARDPILNLPPADAHGAPITTVRALIYSDREGKIIDAAIPAWLLRSMPNAKFSFFDEMQFGPHQTRLTFADVERHGPGLILDGYDQKGSRILIWAE